MSQQQQPSNGRIVRFVVDAEHAKAWNARCDGRSVQECDVLPAMIVWACTSDMVSLRVFRDAHSDGYITGVPYADAQASRPRTWHWPARS